MARKHLARTGAVALVLSLGVAAGTAYAYYTDTQHAQGMISFSYTPDTPDTPEDPDTPTTEVDEYPVDGQKTVTVKNTGKVRGTEVVQLYVRDLVASVTRPTRQLKGFERVTLEPGESRAAFLARCREALIATGRWNDD